MHENFILKLYNRSVQEARQEVTEYQEVNGPIQRPIQSTAQFIKVHYTFDYSQAISIPHHVCQVWYTFGRFLKISDIETRTCTLLKRNSMQENLLLSLDVLSQKYFTLIGCEGN